jgi:GR25 family glycosyltransferase involved in LPS biosynthesis
MLLVIKITRTQLANYRKEFLQCLKHNSENVYINQIYVFTDDIDHKILMKKTSILFKRKIPTNDDLITEIKKISKYNKIMISDPFIQFQNDLYKVTDEDLKINILKNQNYLIFSKNSKFYNGEFETKQTHINLSINKIKTNIQNEIEVVENKSVLIKKSIYDPNKVSPTIRNKKLDVLIVSVNYNDYLLVSLVNNIKVFENITVVTTNEDIKCQEICKNLGVNCVISERVYDDGAKFNKGKAINDGIKSLHNPDLILLLDSDIVVKEKIDLKSLSDDVLYTSNRIIYKDYNSFISECNEIEEIDKGWGFFQLFCFNNPVLNKEYPFPESSETADGSDLVFRDYFEKRRSINKKVIHLGDTKKNWKGRVTEKFITDEQSQTLINETKFEINKYLNNTCCLNLDKRQKSITPKLAVITTFYNPKKYVNIRYNYLKFSEKIKEKADLFPIELSFDGDFFIDDENVIQIKGDKKNILWQKEVLLNLALDKIPKEYTNIAWVDCDIIFENENWVEECNYKLNDYKVVQLYEWAKRLGPNSEIEMTSRGIISRIHEINKVDINLSKGIPGFAWAIRREVIDEIKFLETQIIGGGDSLMFYSFFGIKRGFQTEQMNEKWFKKFSDWSDKAFENIDKSVSFVSGEITHLYHGSKKNRNYNKRYDILNKYEFDPLMDLSKDKNGIWELNNKQISKELEKYFEDRNEDDNIIDINSYFDKIFVLNLERRPDRWSKISEKLNKLGINFEKFNAIDGNNLEFDNSNFVEGRGMIENKFALGCLESHLEIIKIARENNYRRILIFEDDILISEDIKILIQNLRELKSWKLLYLGSSQYDWNVEMYNDNFYLSKKSLGTFAYAVDESIYTEAIDFLENRNKSVDNILSDIQQKNYGECFTFYPNICKADVSESEIREERDNVEHSKKMRWNLLKDYV